MALHMAPRIALMLYTVRDRAAADLRDVLESCQEWGCDGVEFAGLHGHTAATVRSWLDQLRLACASMHVGLADLDAAIDRVASDAATLGTRRVVMPWVPAPQSAAEAADVVSRVRRAALALRAHGISLGYHNHDFEFARFADGSRMWESVLAASEVFIEPDVGWLWFAGLDPAAELASLSGRVPLVHAKDFASREKPHRFCPTGTGAVPMEAAIRAAIAAGTDWLIAEQDQAEDPMLAASQCVANLRVIRDRALSREATRLA